MVINGLMDYRDRPTGKLMCRHCGVRMASRARALCSVCYNVYSIRHQYPRSVCETPYVNDRNHPLPSTPTDALPGSEDKIRVLEYRAYMREQLFHPLDAVN